MAEYIYRTTVSANNEGFGEDNADNYQDFYEHKDFANKTTEIDPSPTALFTDCSYLDFKDKFLLWSSVYYTERRGVYNLFVISSIPL